MDKKRVKIVGLPDSNSSYKKSLSPVKREDANLEAEKGERVVTDLDNDNITESYDIKGKKHYDGGTPLNLPENSFIFSDDKSLKIKDVEVLRSFGIKGSDKKLKKGMTPAEIHKKFDNNKYIEILKDKNSNAADVNTATLMLDRNNANTGKLALYQESLKGFVDGIPDIAMPYLEKTEQDPAMLEQAIMAQKQQEAQAVTEEVQQINQMQQQSMAPADNLQSYMPQEGAPLVESPQQFQYGGSTDLKQYALAGSVDSDPPKGKKKGDWLKTRKDELYYKVNDTYIRLDPKFAQKVKWNKMESDGTSSDNASLLNDLKTAAVKTYARKNNLDPYEFVASYKNGNTNSNSTSNTNQSAETSNTVNEQVVQEQQVVQEPATEANSENSDPPKKKYTLHTVNGKKVAKDENGGIHEIKEDGARVQVEGKYYNVGESKMYRPENFEGKYKDVLTEDLKKNEPEVYDALENALLEIEEVGPERVANAMKKQVAVLSEKGAVYGSKSKLKGKDKEGFIKTQYGEYYDEYAQARKDFQNLSTEEIVLMAVSQEVNNRTGKNFDLTTDDGDQAISSYIKSGRFFTDFGGSKDDHKRAYNQLLAFQSFSTIFPETEAEPGNTPYGESALAVAVEGIENGTSEMLHTSPVDGLPGLNTLKQTNTGIPSKFSELTPIQKAKKDQAKSPGAIDPGNESISVDENPYAFWKQDVNNLKRNVGKQLELKKYLPFEADVDLQNVNPAFKDFRQEAQAAGSIASIAMNDSYGVTAGQSASRNMASQGQLMDNIAGAMQRNQDGNIDISNQYRNFNNGIDNKQIMLDADRKNSLYDKNTIANQQYDNSMSMLRDEQVRLKNRAFTNASNTYNANLLNPNMKIDPRSAGAISQWNPNKLTDEAVDPVDKRVRDNKYILERQGQLIKDNDLDATLAYEIAYNEIHPNNPLNLKSSRSKSKKDVPDDQKYQGSKKYGGMLKKYIY